MTFLEWLKKQLGITSVPPYVQTTTPPSLGDHHQKATEANAQAEDRLDRIREMRAESSEVHRTTERLRRENHFAELVERALGGAR